MNTNSKNHSSALTDHIWTGCFDSGAPLHCPEAIPSLCVWCWWWTALSNTSKISIRREVTGHCHTRQLFHSILTQLNQDVSPMMAYWLICSLLHVVLPHYDSLHRWYVDSCGTFCVKTSICVESSLHNVFVPVCIINKSWLVMWQTKAPQ